MGSATSVTGYIQLPPGISFWKAGAHHELQELVSQFALCGALELGGYFHLAVVTLLERGRPVLGFALGDQVIGGEVV